MSIEFGMLRIDTCVMACVDSLTTQPLDKALCLFRFQGFSYFYGRKVCSFAFFEAWWGRHDDTGHAAWIVQFLY